MQANGFPSDARLTPSIALAALLHGALILLVPIARDTGPAPLELRLALARPAEAPAPAVPARAQPRAEQPVPPTVRPQPIPLPAPDRAAAPADPSPEPESAARRGELSAQVIAQVRSALARYFVYPAAAQRQGWQGEVLLGFSVSREGRIDHVEVVRSSGYRLLDEAARASLARVGRLPEYAAGDEPLQIRMPIIYRLEG